MTPTLLRSPLVSLLVAAIPLGLAPACGGDDGTAAATSGTGGGTGGGAGQGGAGQGGGGQGGGGVCAPGETELCYSGPAGTETAGLCKAGVQTCLADGSGYGPCEGEVTPQPETCASAGDDDCDGMANEEGADCVCAPGEMAGCYTGPAGTEDVGACHGGTQVCNADGVSYGPCEGEVAPQAEACSTPEDDDCDGEINEEGAGCLCTPNTTANCYSGPPGTENVGNCLGGTMACNSQGTAWGPCVGEVTPQSEDCATPGDDDCDGQINESSAGCVCAPNTTASCYSGPPGTAGVGICAAGSTTCNAQGTAWGPCAGEVTPQPENCSTPADESCNGAAGPCGAFWWGQRFGDAVDQDAVDVVADAQGNVYLAGNFAGSIDLGGGPLVSGGVGTTDMFVAKFTPAGAHLWSKRFGSANSHDVVRSLALDGAGNLLLTGRFAVSIDFGGGAIANGSESDPFVAKLDTNGNHVWSKGFAGSGGNEGTGVAVDPQGNVLVTGMFTGFVNCGGPVLFGDNSNDIFVAKLTAAGDHVWSQSYGGTAAEITRSIDVDSTGAASIIGYFSGTLDVGGASFTALGSNDVLLFKLSAAGAHVWSKAFSGVGSNIGHRVVVDGAGNVHASGYVQGSADFGGGLTMGGNGNDVFVAKYDAAGAHLWSRRWSAPAEQLGYGLAVDGSGNVALTGRLEGATDFGGGPLASAGMADAFVVALDPSGMHLWSQRFGDAVDQRGRAVGFDPSGNVLVAGQFQGTLDFGVGPLVSAGGYDVFLAKLGP